MLKQIFRLGVLGLIAAAAFGRSAKVSKEFKDVDPSASVDIIVQFREVPTQMQHQKVANQGGTLKRSFHAVNAAAYTVPASALDGLADDPDVVHISPDHRVKAMLDYTAAAVNAASAWQASYTGKGIAIAVIDSGISNNPDLAGRVLYKQDFVGDTPATTQDRYGHGEHVAGIAAGSGASSSCPICTRLLKGMAPAAGIVNLRVLDQNGAGTDSSVIAAIEQAITLRHNYNIRVINLSLGRPVYESYTVDPLCQAVEAAWNAGIVVVAAAGNDGRDNSQGTEGYGTITAPGNDPYVITVGAMNTMGTYSRADDIITSYSSKGPTMIDHVVKPDIVAPGNQVVSLRPMTSTLAANYPQDDIYFSYYLNLPVSGWVSPTYFRLSGTSMATPVVSGAAADLLQAEPNLTPDQVKAILMLTAYKQFPASSTVTDPATGQTFTDYYDVFTVGAGYLDIQAALNETNIPVGNALSPIASYDPSTGNVYLSAYPNSIWGSQSVWGVQSIWGVQSVWGVNEVAADQSVWGVNSIWGVSGTEGFNSIWDVQSVWGVTTDESDATSVLISGDK